MTRRSFCAGLVFLSGTPMLVRGAESAERVDLVGRWILTMPTGTQWNARFEKNCRCGHIQLRCGADLLQGEYELNGERLAVARPKDGTMTGQVWRVRNKNLLELVEQPAAAQFGSDYRGAVLVRRIAEDGVSGNEG